MLTTATAQAQLQQWRIVRNSHPLDADDESTRFAGNFLKLPSELASAAFAIFGCDATGRRVAENTPIPQSAAMLDALTSEQRIRIWKIVFPRMATEIESAWQFHLSLPYHDRFRAPSYPAASRRRRATWIANLFQLAEELDENILDPVFLAVWAPYLPKPLEPAELPGKQQEMDGIGILLASVMTDAGRYAETVFKELREIILNTHPIGMMAPHVIDGMMMSPREDGWELLETIFPNPKDSWRFRIVSTVAYCHPQVFHRILRWFLSARLSGSSRIRVPLHAVTQNALISAFVDSQVIPDLESTVAAFLEFLENSDARKAALSGFDPIAFEQALSVVALSDAVASINISVQVLRQDNPQLRYAAVLHLKRLNLAKAEKYTLNLTEDEDLRIAYVSAFESATVDDFDTKYRMPAGRADHIQRLLRLHERFPYKPIRIPPLIGTGWPHSWERSTIETFLLRALKGMPLDIVRPHLSRMSSSSCTQIIGFIKAKPEIDAIHRGILIDLCEHAHAAPRYNAFSVLQTIKLSRDEAAILLDRLTTKVAARRLPILDTLLTQPDDAVLSYADQLLASANLNQRLGGLELLRQMFEASRRNEDCLKRANEYRAGRHKLVQLELDLLAGLKTRDLASTSSTLAAPESCESLRLSPVVPPQNRGTKIMTQAAMNCLLALDKLVQKHGDISIRTKATFGAYTQKATVQEFCPVPNWWASPSSQTKFNPLHSQMEHWYQQRSVECRDPDGLELVRLWCWMKFVYSSDFREAKRSLPQAPYRQSMLEALGSFDRIKLKHEDTVSALVDWLVLLHRHPQQKTFLLDAAETLCASVPDEELQQQIPPADGKRRPSSNYRFSFRHCHYRDNFFGNYPNWMTWLERLELPGTILTQDEELRRWQLCRWLDEPIAGASRNRPRAVVLLQAYAAGAATLDDITDAVMGPPRLSDIGSSIVFRRPIPELPDFFEKHPEVKQHIIQLRERLVESELQRGEVPTPLTENALALEELLGISTLIRLLQAVDRDGFSCQPLLPFDQREELLRTGTLMRLIAATYPAEGETPKCFTRSMTAAGISERQLLDMIFVAPQWLRFVEEHLQWEGLTEAVYWLIAHVQPSFPQRQDGAAESAGYFTNRANWRHLTPLCNEIDEVGIDGETEGDDQRSNDNGYVFYQRPLSWHRPWKRLLKERTPFTEYEFSEGTIDVDWFRRVHQVLGPDRWNRIVESARLAGTKWGGARAKWICSVLVGDADFEKLVARISKGRSKEAVRLLGLYPIATGKDRDADLARRLDVLQEYGEFAKHQSEAARPECMEAFRIGLSNLASAAGYADPLRLDWSLASKQWDDLRRGPVLATKDNVTVILQLDESDRPVITAKRGNRILKGIPSTVMKAPPIAELLQRGQDLRKQASRQRRALEAMMCRGDVIPASELKQLMQHALLAPLLERLVMTGNGVMGYVINQGKALRDYAGRNQPIKKQDQLRLAHPHDFFTKGDWFEWQRECFEAGRVQPFKQVFRELYIPTQAELELGDRSLRFSGLIIDASRALKILGRRDWYAGDIVFKPWRSGNIEAHLDFGENALDAGNLVISEIHFWDRATNRRMKLEKVDPRCFSEAMRDVNFVTNVATLATLEHVKWVISPEIIALREALVRETIRLRNLSNVRIELPVVVIDGMISTYRIHLGTGAIERITDGPSKELQVNAENSPNLFLPFTGNDKQIAELLSRIMLLARDDQIRDAEILAQLQS